MYPEPPNNNAQNPRDNSEWNVPDHVSTCWRTTRGMNLVGKSSHGSSHYVCKTGRVCQSLEQRQDATYCNSKFSTNGTAYWWYVECGWTCWCSWGGYSQHFKRSGKDTFSKSLTRKKIQSCSSPIVIGQMPFLATNNHIKAFMRALKALKETYTQIVTMEYKDFSKTSPVQ